MIDVVPNVPNVPNVPSVAPAWAATLAAASRWTPDHVDAIVVVPHPDDESVMFGGLMNHLIGRGAHLRFIAVTDGGAAYPDLVSTVGMQRVRRHEQRDALEALGVGGAQVTRLGIPDGEVAAHEALVRDAIIRALDERPAGLIVAPWEFDHHTDHEACGRAALAAWRRTTGEVELASGLFWSLLRERPPTAISVRAVPLAVSQRTAKARAIACHRSQVTTAVADRPVLSAPELAVTRWPLEHYVVRDER